MHLVPSSLFSPPPPPLVREGAGRRETLGTTVFFRAKIRNKLKNQSRLQTVNANPMPSDN